MKSQDFGVRIRMAFKALLFDFPVLFIPQSTRDGRHDERESVCVCLT